MSWWHSIILFNNITINEKKKRTMNKRALIVEDNEDLSYIFSEILQEAGFETDAVFAGHNALAWLSETKPDLVILDVSLPDISGINVLKKIRADDRLKDLKVFITTADSSVLNSLGDQADLVLIKPVMYDQLLNAVNRLEW